MIGFRGTFDHALDSKHRLTIPAKFDKAANFTGGLAGIEVENQDGYINKEGKYVWEPR